jgi:hypothetical protein
VRLDILRSNVREVSTVTLLDWLATASIEMQGYYRDNAWHPSTPNNGDDPTLAGYAARIRVLSNELTRRAK